MPPQQKTEKEQEEHSYKWSTIKYNSINTGHSQTFSEVIVASKCIPLARIGRQAMSSLDLHKSFSKIREAPV